MRDPQIFGGGLADPVLQSQAVFRTVMDAMARPGSIHGVDGQALAPPGSLLACAAAVALTLCDHDTPVWLDPALAKMPALPEWLTFHTGAPIVQDPGQAAFAMVKGATMPDLACMSAGSDEYPDRSTTLIVEVDNLCGGKAMTLSGPGISGSRPFSPRGLPTDFAARWAANIVLFPRGIDLILCAPNALAALPRTTRIITEPAN